MGQFTQETAVVRRSEHVWQGEVRKGWRIGEVPNGGYILAIAGRALSEALPHADPLSVNAFYLAPTILGEIDCHVEVLRRGRNTTQASVKMYQQGELKVQVTAAYTDLASLSGENWSAQQRPAITAWEDSPSGGGLAMEFRQRVEIRLTSGAGSFAGSPDGSGEFNGWVRHADGADCDTLSLLLFADAMPPSVFSLYGPVAWVPTVELTVQVRAKPAPGPVQARLASRYLTAGVVEEDGEYWDSSGALVALSRQTAKLRVPTA